MDSASMWYWSTVKPKPTGLAYIGVIYKKFFVDGAPPNTGGTNYHAGGLYPNSIPQTLTAIYFNASVPAPPKNFTVAPTSPPPPIIANPGPTPTNSKLLAARPSRNRSNAIAALSIISSRPASSGGNVPAPGA